MAWAPGTLHRMPLCLRRWVTRVLQRRLDNSASLPANSHRGSIFHGQRCRKAFDQRTRRAKLAKAVRRKVGVRGLSSFVARAMAHELEREQLGSYLAEMHRDPGSVPKKVLALACARAPSAISELRRLHQGGCPPHRVLMLRQRDRQRDADVRSRQRVLRVPLHLRGRLPTGPDLRRRGSRRPGRFGKPLMSRLLSRREG